MKPSVASVASISIAVSSFALGAVILTVLATTPSAPPRRPPAAPSAPVAAPIAKPATKVPALRAEDTILGFGRVTAGQSLQKVFVLHNDSDRPLEISRAKPSCGCAALKFDKVVPAHGTGLFEVAISGASVKPGKLSHHIELTTNDPDIWLLLIEADVDAKAAEPSAPAAIDAGLLGR